MTVQRLLPTPNRGVAKLARLTLASYLQTQLGANVAVRTEWPPPNTAVPDLAVTIVSPKGGEDVSFWPGEMFGDPEPIPGDDVNAIVNYHYGEWNLPMQMDLWAKSKPALIDLQRRVYDAVHRFPTETIPPSYYDDGQVPPLPELDGWYELVLQSTELLGTLVCYRFNEDEQLEMEDSVEAQEYRFSWRGTSDGFYVAQKNLPLVKALILTLNNEQTTVTP